MTQGTSPTRRHWWAESRQTRAPGLLLVLLEEEEGSAHRGLLVAARGRGPSGLLCEISQYFNMCS